MPEWLSILPPLLAIAIAVWKKEVLSSLLCGIWLAEGLYLFKQQAVAMPVSSLDWLLLLPKLIGLGFLGMLDRIVTVFESAGDTRVLLFGLVVGALLELMRRSGGVAALVQRLAGLGFTGSRRKTSALTTLTGTLICIETNLSALSCGVISRQPYDRLGMSRARLAFIVDSTCAPISSLAAPINAWGPYLIGLLAGLSLANPTLTLLYSIPFNFYALLVLGLVWYTVLTTKVHGPMKRVEAAPATAPAEAEASIDPEETPSKARYMLIPLAIMVAGMFFFLFYTGNWDFQKGSGSRSVLYAVTLATLTIVVMLTVDKVFNYKQMIGIGYQGVARLTPVVMIMLLSFAIGASCKALGTGPFVAGFVGPYLHPVLVAPLIFICAGIISFTTGTSWGTFAILIPIAIPLGNALGIPAPFLLSAVLGGGVFGDHCSPISDTTIISSLASGCDHLEHVRTQLPYALAAGSGSIILYMLVWPLL